MQLNRNVKSTVFPPERDTTSSSKFSYINTNVVEIPATEEEPVMYQFDSLVLTKSEYEQYIISEELRTDLEFANEAIAELAEIIGGGE